MRLPLFITLTGIAAAGLMLFTGCASFDSKAEERKADISKEELFKRMRKASDPKFRYRDAKSYVQKQEQEITYGENKVYFIVEVKFKKPHNFKVTTYKNWKPLNALISNGSNVWMADYSKKQTVELKGEQLNRAKFFFEMGQPGNAYSKIFSDIKLTEWIKGPEQYYKLDCTPKLDGVQPMTIFVGKNNFLTKKLETYMETSNDKLVKYVSFMDKYSLYEGIMIASVSTVIIDNIETKYRMINYQLDLDLPDDEFAPPVWSTITE